jgi:two-component system LytT family response regulator
MNKELKVLIVDDEAEARDILERQLLRTGGLRVIGKAASVDEGIELIISDRPDIVFLDVQMPEKDGFELVRELKKYNLKTTVIFVTAHIEYAVNALKAAAFDYLLKPVSFDELKEAVLRFKCERQNEASIKKMEVLLGLLHKPDKICFNTRTGYIYISPGDILYCQADVNYTEIYFSKERKEVVTVNIGKVEELLDGQGFYRISRSYLINTGYLVKADRKLKNCELYKDREKFIVPAPPNQIRALENIIISGTLLSKS